MNDFLIRSPAKGREVRQKLLTGAQRKALEMRVRGHARRLEMKLQMHVNADKEPAEVTKARRFVEKYEKAHAKKVRQRQKVVDIMAQQIISNLLFDSVESCFLQVAEFEERKAPNE